MTVLRSFLLFSPVVVAFFVMLPRLLSPQFGLLDDGLTLIAVTVVSHDWTAAFTMAHGAGRFFPSYFLFYYLVHALVGVHPFLFFAVNYAVFAATTAGLIGLVRLMGGTPFQARAVGIFFVMSGHAVESFYIGSMKRNWIQVAWSSAKRTASIGHSIATLTNSPQQRRLQVGSTGLAALAGFTSWAVKEPDSRRPG